MLVYVLALCLAAIALLSITLRKAYYFLPSKELKRQAEAGDQAAAVLWRAVAYGRSLSVFLWVVLGFASAGCVVLLARVAPPVIGFLAVLLLLSVAFAWLPAARLSGLGVRVTELTTPTVVWVVGNLEPVLQTIASLVDRQRNPHVHNGVYVREDLLDLIERQKTQEGNRLAVEELDMAAAALRFGQKKVRDIVVPRATVKAVAANDEVSPVYLDELHQLLHSCFPVYEDKPDNFVGTLFLRNLTDISEGRGVKGKVKDHMNRGVIYVHENDSLSEALHAFYLSKKPIFIVVNGFEEYVGIITIEDILHALLGKPSDYEFDMYESREAVAGRHKKKPKQVDAHIDEAAEETTEEAPKAEPVPASSDEVVE